MSTVWVSLSGSGGSYGASAARPCGPHLGRGLAVPGRRHLVVVVPGIGGSVLARPGRPEDIVWDAGVETSPISSCARTG